MSPETTPHTTADCCEDIPLHHTFFETTAMPQVEYTTTIDLPRETIWEFVKDMDNWAPFLTGYQSHEAIDERDSIWTLKGDVGVLARVVRLKSPLNVK